MTADPDENPSDPEPKGYGSPPKAHRFQKGRSGNPNGRPRGSKNTTLPYESVLGRKVKIRVMGVEKEITAAEAFVLQIYNQGLKGKPHQTKVALIALEHAKLFGERDEAPAKQYFVVQLVETGSLNIGLEPLGMVKRLGESTSSLRVGLEPWLVKEALKRLGDRRLTLDEQRIVIDATYKPHKVEWPDWWQVRPST